MTLSEDLHNDEQINGGIENVSNSKTYEQEKPLLSHNITYGAETIKQTGVSLVNDGQKKNSGIIQRHAVKISSKLIPSYLCPRMTISLKIMTVVIMLMLLWGVSFFMFRDAVLPQGNLFALATLFSLAYIAGWLVSFIHLPPLLGMLITGIIQRNLGYFNMTGPFIGAVSVLRLVAMVVILIKAGLGLDAGALRRLSLVVIKLAFMPCLIEMLVVSVVSHFILGFPWLWGMLLGFIIAAISPAVVVPSMHALQEKGYGEDKGIATLVVAASSIDDIIAISGFGVILGIIFSQGDLFHQLIQGPVEVIIGLSFGLGWGILLTYFPHRDDDWLLSARVILVGGGGLFAVFGSKFAGYSGAGPLGCIVAAFVACSGWKIQGWSSSYVSFLLEIAVLAKLFWIETVSMLLEKLKNPVANVYAMIWQIFQPVLFGLIGTEINLSQLKGDTVLFGLAVLAIGLAFRILAAVVATQGGILSKKEMLFVAIAWIPKATVQAALSPVALDIARETEADISVLELSSQILTIAVISILITAPIGAVGIHISGPRLLTRHPAETAQEAPL